MMTSCLLFPLLCNDDVTLFPPHSPFPPVSATLTETRQFYTLYNTLEDQKAYMEKEVWSQ